MTSYIICHKRLGLKKSDIELLKKSVEDRKLEYFKSELLKILDKKEKEESGGEISKAFIVQDMYKSMTDALYMAKAGFPVGTIREWKGKKYKKLSEKKWVRVYDKETRGAKLVIAALRRKIDACTDSRELLNLVLANKDRFCDELGRPLPIVQELSKYVSSKNDSLEEPTKKKGGDGGDEPPKDGRFEFTQELKQKAVDALNNPTEEINYVDYTRENYNKLFPRGECKTPIGTIKMGDKQFERFADKDNGARIKFMGALQQCLQKPDVIIGKTDNKGRYSKLYLKAFIDNNGKKAYLAVVPNIDNIDIVVSNSPRDTKDIAKEIKKAGLCYYIRPALTSSANSGGSRMENSTDGLTSNNSRNEEVKPSDNSNIAQDYTVVNKKDKENPAVKKSFASMVNELKKSYFDNIGA